jgi:hypothetical protein
MPQHVKDIHGNFVTFENNKTQLIWKELLDHYEIDHNLEYAKLITFVKCTSRVINLKCQYWMYFKNPIPDSDALGFYRIPGFIEFSIDKSANVRSINTGRILKTKLGPYGYPYVNIYDVDKKRWRSVSTHILLARAFVKNDDPFSQFFVNHKDGDKVNLSLNNLEWVTSVRNQNHAIETGLRQDNFPCKVRDSTTGSVLIFPSISKALAAIDLKSKATKIVRSLKSKIIPKLLNGRFEIKSLLDKSDWYYTTPEKIKQDFKNRGPYQIFCVADSTVVEIETAKEIAKFLSVPIWKINHCLRYPEIRMLNGYLLRVKSSDPWPETYRPIEIAKPRFFKVTDLNTKETVTVKGVLRVVKRYGIDKRTLKNRLRTGNSYGSLVFQEIS